MKGEKKIKNLESIKKTIGFRLKKTRENKKMSLELLAELIGMNVVDLIGCEKNKKPMTLVQLLDIAFILKVDPLWLITGKASDGSVVQMPVSLIKNTMLIENGLQKFNLHENHITVQGEPGNCCFVVSIDNNNHIFPLTDKEINHLVSVLLSFLLHK
jgi:transcriptional regulator with XRE-family HTH domain